MNEKFIEKVKAYREVIGLVTTVISVATAIVLFAVSYKLAPVVKTLDDQGKIIKEVQATQQEEKPDHAFLKKLETEWPTVSNQVYYLYQISGGK